MKDPIHEAIPLDGTPEDAPAARAAARDVFRRARCDEHLGGDALLCLSELVTNAILHAGGSLCVEITATATTVRLEVTDGMAPSDDLGRQLGRGLAIVDQLARDWGVVAVVVEERLGKKIWAELAATRHTSGADGGAPREPGEAVLVDVPIRLFLASEADLDTLLRDLQLVAAEWASRHDRLVKGLADSLRRTQGARTAAMDEVRRRLDAGDDVVTLRLPMTAETPNRAREFLEVVLLSEARTGRDDDVVDPVAAEVRHFRRWCAAELTHQANGGSPRRCPFRP